MNSFEIIYFHLPSSIIARWVFFFGFFCFVWWGKSGLDHNLLIELSLIGIVFNVRVPVNISKMNGLQYNLPQQYKTFLREMSNSNEK